MPTLRNATIKLAFENPDLQKHIIPLLKEAGMNFQVSNLKLKLMGELERVRETISALKLFGLDTSEAEVLAKTLQKRVDGLQQKMPLKASSNTRALAELKKDLDRKAISGTEYRSLKNDVEKASSEKAAMEIVSGARKSRA